MPDIVLQAKFIWDVDTVLSKATTAAVLMDLRITQRNGHGFKAGSQWWGEYELVVSAKTFFRTTLTIGASTHKIFYQAILRDRAETFLSLAKNPTNEVGRKEALSVELREPTQSWLENRREAEWWALPDDDESSRVVESYTLPMEAKRGRLAWESLRRRTSTMGLGLPGGGWDPLSEVVAEALEEAPDDLPVFVQTPMDVERWYGALQRSWSHIPGMVDSLNEAMNHNRQLNAQWFQANGHGGHLPAALRRALHHRREAARRVQGSCCISITSARARTGAPSAARSSRRCAASSSARGAPSVGLSRRTCGRPSSRQRYSASSEASARLTVDAAARRSTYRKRRKSRAA